MTTDVDQAVRALAKTFPWYVSPEDAHEASREAVMAIRAALSRTQPEHVVSAVVPHAHRALAHYGECGMAAETIPAPPAVPNVAPSPTIPALPTRATYTWSTMRSKR